MVTKEKMDRVLAEILEEELIELTARLVKINSVWDPEAGTGEEEAALAVADWARREGFTVEVDSVAPGRPNVIVTHGSGGGRRLMFEGHTDVVTPGDPTEWRYDPFGAEIVGRRMYGRGTNDTKGNLAACLIAMAALKRSGVELAGSILGGVLCDEEDRMLGVLDFIDRGRADGVTAAVICEPEENFICLTQKGALRVRFLVRGRMSHGAMPLAGLNPAPAIARVIDGLAGLERLAAEEIGRDEYLGWPSFTPTVIRAPSEGPGQINVVPAAAEVLVDIRTVGGQDHRKIVADLKGLALEAARAAEADCAAADARLGCRRERSLGIEIEILTDRPTTLTDRSDPIVSAIHWAIEDVTGRTPVYAGVPGATDGTYLWSKKGIPIVTTGAGDRFVPHQKDEWVDLDQLYETARIYALTALAYLEVWGGMTDRLIGIRNLSVVFKTPEGKVRPVDGLDLELAEGETVGLVGESGCGKSVTALSIMGLIPTPPGRIVADRLNFEGQNLLELSAEKMRRVRGRRISMIFQEPMTSLNPVIPIGRQVAEPLMVHEGLPYNKARERVIDWLERVRIPGAGDRLGDYPHQLSGGMRQRVMIAMALITSPRLLIADEPTTALDVTIQAQILSLLVRLKDEVGSAVLLITHDLGVVAQTCLRVVVMYAGEAVEEAGTIDLFERPAHPYTRGLLRSIPVMRDRPEETHRRLVEIPGLVPALTERVEGCKFNARCRHAFALCRERKPELAAIEGEGHRVRCWLTDHPEQRRTDD